MFLVIAHENIAYLFFLGTGSSVEWAWPAKYNNNTDEFVYNLDKTVQSFKTYATSYSLVNKGGKEGIL